MRTEDGDAQPLSIARNVSGRTAPGVPVLGRDTKGNLQSTAKTELNPFRRRAGQQRRRLLRLIDALERQFRGAGGAGFIVRDHYIARLLTLLELLSSAYG
jgi:hypothetical protein